MKKSKNSKKGNEKKSKIKATKKGGREPKKRGEKWITPKNANPTQKKIHTSISSSHNQGTNTKAI